MPQNQPAARKHRTWSAEDERYLRDSCGNVSIPGIAKHLGRSVDAVKIRAHKIGLGNMLSYGDYITLNQLLRALSGGGGGGNGYKMESWVKKRGLPIHTQKRINTSCRVVYLDEFWEWAEKNRSFLDFSKIPHLAIGAEPDWVAEQRRNDFKGFAIQRKDPWTSEDDSRLIMLLRQHKYTYAELSEMIHRSSGAIQRRCCDLGIKERPVKVDNHGESSKWSADDFEILADGIRRGESYTTIGRKIGKSDKAIRGKVYFVYLTENADKIRQMMGLHEFGYGAPEPTVRQAVNLSRTRTAAKAAMTDLCGVLAARLKTMKQSGYDNYFQRSMCRLWDDLEMVCTAGCDDCDSCTEFIRIAPQYCARCGATFYERADHRFCAPCRSARRAQAYRKYRALQGKR